MCIRWGKCFCFIILFSLNTQFLHAYLHFLFIYFYLHSYVHKNLFIYLYIYIYILNIYIHILLFTFFVNIQISTNILAKRESERTILVTIPIELCQLTRMKITSQNVSTFYHNYFHCILYITIFGAA